MSNVIDVYKCPHCGGALSYNPEWAQYSCTMCDSVFDIELFRPKKARQLYGFSCPECGAQVVGAKEIVSFSCPYCGNNEIVAGRFEGEFAPDSIIPFKFDKKGAKSRFVEFAKSRVFLPDDFLKESRIISTEGVYVPFWLFSGKVQFDITYSSKVSLDNGTADYLDLRKGSFSFSRIPADASLRMPNNMMDSLRPYDFKELQPFTTDCMPGFVAELFTETVDDSWQRVERQVLKATYDETWPTDGKEIKSVYENVEITGPRGAVLYEHVLLPVWLFVIEYCGKRYLAGVNGQTGRVAINFPIDEEKQKALCRQRALLYAVISGVGALVAFAAFALYAICKELSTETIMSESTALAVLLVVAVACIAYCGYRSGFKIVQEHMENVRDINTAKGFIDEGSIRYTSNFSRRDWDNSDRRLTEDDQGLMNRLLDETDDRGLVDKLLNR